MRELYHRAHGVKDAGRYLLSFFKGYSHADKIDALKALKTYLQNKGSDSATLLDEKQLKVLRQGSSKVLLEKLGLLDDLTMKDAPHSTRASVKLP